MALSRIADSRKRQRGKDEVTGRHPAARPKVGDRDCRQMGRQRRAINGEERLILKELDILGIIQKDEQVPAKAA